MTSSNKRKITSTKKKKSIKSTIFENPEIVDFFIRHSSQWRRFNDVIGKAIEACRSSGNNVSDHFAEVGKMVDIGSASKREIDDYELSRYACYLIVMNGDEATINIDITRMDERNGSMDMNLKVKNKNYASEYMMNIEDTIFGEPYSHSEMFYTDGFEHSIRYRYVRPDNYVKMKMLMEPDEARMYFTSAIDGIVLNPEYLTDFQLVSVSERKQCLTFCGKPEAFKSIAANISDSTIAKHVVAQELNIKELSGAAEIDSEGNLTKIELYIDVFQRDVLCDMEMRVEYINPGQPCSFSFPSSAEYIEFITVEEPTDDNINYTERQAMSEIEEPDGSRQIYADAVRKISNLESYAATVYVRNEDRRGNEFVRDMDTNVDVKIQNKNSLDAKCLLNIWNDRRKLLFRDCIILNGKIQIIYLTWIGIQMYIRIIGVGSSLRY